MTIHHDKLAYGRLEGASEELDARKLDKMLAELNGGNGDGEEEEDCENKPQNNRRQGE